ncbi:hypothetical protein TWF694_011060 [Orbilia ellipsospora]|uniref:AB hydrolase-1 domain-containing protein n=1 Tax=Orbilia ellipsospora TaxID=2528407 RepID=A0AAV9X7W9_9PEZI
MSPTITATATAAATSLPPPDKPRRHPHSVILTAFSSSRSAPASPITSPTSTPRTSTTIPLHPSSAPPTATITSHGYIHSPLHSDKHHPRISSKLHSKRLSTSSRYSTSSARAMSNFWAEIVNTTAFSYVKLSIAASTGLAALLSTALYFKQNDLIYPRHFPPEARTEMFNPGKFHVQSWETVNLETPDEETLRCYFLRGAGIQRKGVTILLLHGNAGNVGYRIPIAKVFAEQMGCNVFMLGYRGYGLSTGKPDEKGLKIDAETALDWIFRNDETKDTRVVIYGQSLGGAIGIQTAAKYQDQLSGMILENTFTSMRAVIPNVFPPAKYITRLCHQVWPSEETIPKIERIPILFLSGLMDELVPPSHMKRLHHVSKATVKVWKELVNGTHNDSVLEAGYFEYINDFINDEVMRHKKAQ